MNYGGPGTTVQPATADPAEPTTPLARVGAFLAAHASVPYRAGRDRSIALTHDRKAKPYHLTLFDLTALVETLRQVNDFHSGWGDTDGDSLDPLALWEDLGFLLEPARGESR